MDLLWPDVLFLFALICVWLTLLLNIVLTFAGYLFADEVKKMEIDILAELPYYPMVSILIPAHNEASVIGSTVRTMLRLIYPPNRLEIIVINDNSSDNSAEILAKIKEEHPERCLNIINTTQENGGKGKSNALNIGYQASSGECLVVYDADNTPEQYALKYLILCIESSNKLGAVIGKFRTRNKKRNLLTRFINIETLGFQWMAQAGRWKLLKLCTIPGTNFAIRRSIVEALGGWDEKAIAEDTEVSFRIYQMGYRIAFMPLAVTWEQEPETLKVWMKQRTRWVSGNIYVLIKHIMHIYRERSISVIFDLFYFISVYFLFFSSVIISDILFVLGLFNLIELQLGGNFFLLWTMAYLLFILEIGIALSAEKNEGTFENLCLIALMYFTYSQLWLVVAFKGIAAYFRTSVLGRQLKWYKTERF